MAELQSPNLNQYVGDPNLTDLLSLFMRQIKLDLNCCHIGTVQSFDSTKQTASVTINYTKSYSSGTQMNTVKQVSYPLVADCPIVVLGGGSSYVSFPISPGDECMVLFNDRDIDNWFSFSTVGAPVATGRLHSFSDGLIIVGVRSKNNFITNFDTARAIFGNKNSAYVGVSATKVKIANQTKNLETILQNLITALDNLKIDVASFGVATGTVSATSISDLNAVAADLGALLE